MKNCSSEDGTLACCLTIIAKEEDNDIKEHFLTVSIDEHFWMEDPVLERHLCIHEDAQHDLCPYLCPYDLNQQHLAQEDVQYIDPNDIFEFQDVMVYADDDMPSLEDILEL